MVTRKSGRVKVCIEVDIEDCDCRKPRILWDLGPVSEQRLPGPQNGDDMITLTDTQQVGVSVSPIDKKGKPAAVESVAFTTSDESVATVTQDPSDPKKALVVAGDPGTAQISVSADADLGDGVETITGLLDVTVLAGKAVSLEIAAGVPEEQP